MSGSDDDDLRTELAKLRKENAILKKRVAATATSNAPKSPAKKGKVDKPVGATDVKKALATLFTQVKRNVKKQGHSQQKKPRAEAATAVWTEEVWNAATEGLEVTGKVRDRHFDGHVLMTVSSLKSTKKASVAPDFAVERLGWDAAIHPVKFTGKVWALKSTSVSVYAIAGYDSIVLSFVPKTGLVTAKVRTYLAATGNSNIEATVAAIAESYKTN
jgi:hypothetical protein